MRSCQYRFLCLWARPPFVTTQALPRSRVAPARRPLLCLHIHAAGVGARQLVYGQGPVFESLCHVGLEVPILPLGVSPAPVATAGCGLPPAARASLALGWGGPEALTSATPVRHHQQLRAPVVAVRRPLVL